MALLLDGKKIRDKILAALKREISGLDPKPALTIIQVGDRPDSSAFIRQKKIYGEKIGARIIHLTHPTDITEKKLLAEIKKCNADPAVHGILVQMPLPKHIDKHVVLEAISEMKDIDGLSSTNTQFLWEGKIEGHMPATARGILALLDSYRIPIEGKNVTVIGKSTLVGKPVSLAFLNRGATVTVCHKQTKNLMEHAKAADILIVAAGSTALITKEYVHKNQVVIDVGINEEKSGDGKKLVGDVDFKSVEPIARMITPVPGGVGPMTVASLFENLMDAYRALA